ncbi:LysR family transcriptional regulator [Longirhabdus pacifica]|uniref:LysR family transcriptional regulator n=1 Tax=Longirhabdus pacifica TaxID=2305227 RepID=UPI001008A5A9|nr:LysR family transcriptional regulator [Longirhabdus pacifica]
MELRQLQYFAKVARKQHVTKAAEELHVAQSAVSRQIHQLEEQLGVNLFLQQGRNLQLTPVGSLFLRRVETILASLDRAVDEIREFIDPELGEIRLGFPHSMGVHLVPFIVSLFRQKHPNVKFKFKQGKYQSLIQSLLNAEIDLAFISPFPSEVNCVKGDVLYTEELLAILPSNHELAGESSIKLNQLKEDSFVMFGEGFSLREIVMNACKEAGFTPSISFEGEETDTIRGLVAAGMGVSLLPEMALQYASSPLKPVHLSISDQNVTRTIGLIHREKEALPIVAEQFKQFIVKHFE